MHASAARAQVACGTATPGAGIERDLADLRRLWGQAYRITWQGKFRATHIISGQAIYADDALELRRRIRDHYSEHAAG